MLKKKSIEKYAEKLIELLKIEHQGDVDYFDNMRLLPVFQIEDLGYCITNMKISGVNPGLYGKGVITFKVDHQLARKHKLTNGKIVALMNGIKEEGSGIVGESTHTSVTVSFSEVLNTYKLCNPLSLWLLPNSIEFRRCMKALQELQFDNGDETLTNIKEILGGLREPSELLSNFDEDTLNDLKDDKYNEKLNEVQRKSIEHGLRAKELAIIHGPPGTGKTTTLVELITMACLSTEAKILCGAHSNKAVDSIAEKLICGVGGLNIVRVGHPDRMSSKVQKRSLDALVQKVKIPVYVAEARSELNKLYKKLADAINETKVEKIKKKIAIQNNIIKLFEKEAVNIVLDKAEVILCTNCVVGGEKMQEYIESNLKDNAFDIVVIDECAQAPEPSCWIPLIHAKKVIFAGDHKQLGPTIISPIAASRGLSKTLFEKMIEAYPHISKILTVQYRMNEQIMKFASESMYKNKLVAAESVANISLSDNFEYNSSIPDMFIEECALSHSLGIIDTSEWTNLEFRAPGEKSLQNQVEASTVIVIYKKLLSLGLLHDDIGVITPYAAQNKAIQQLLRQYVSDDEDNLGEVSTVDGFQGSEKEVIIISMVRSNFDGQIGFLKDERRMNVAVTRAKKVTFMTGII